MSLINGINQNDALLGTREADSIFGSNGNDFEQGAKSPALVLAQN
jgi:hypothetical protein